MAYMYVVLLTPDDGKKTTVISLFICMHVMKRNFGNPSWVWVGTISF